MPQKLNKAGKMQDYIPKGNGDASGEYGTSNGTNKNFTTSDKKKTQANVINENKSVVVENKGKKNKGYSEVEKADWGIKENEKQIATLEKSGKYPDMLKRLKEQNEILKKQKQEVLDGKREKIDLADDGVKRKEEKLPWEDNKANIIDNDLSGKKDNYNKALDDLKQWEIKENDSGEERIKKVKEQEKYIKNSDFVNSDTKLSKDYEFKSLKNIDDVNKMYDLIKETGINPKSIYEKGKYPNTENLVKEKLTKMYIDGKIKIDTTNNSKIPTYSGRLTKKQFADYVVGTLMENMRYRISQNKYKD